MNGTKNTEKKCKKYWISHVYDVCIYVCLPDEKLSPTVLCKTSSKNYFSFMMKIRMNAFTLFVIYFLSIILQYHNSTTVIYGSLNKNNICKLIIA